MHKNDCYSKEELSAQVKVLENEIMAHQSQAATQALQIKDEQRLRAKAEADAAAHFAEQKRIVDVWMEREKNWERQKANLVAEIEEQRVKLDEKDRWYNDKVLRVFEEAYNEGTQVIALRARVAELEDCVEAYKGQIKAQSDMIEAERIIRADLEEKLAALNARPQLDAKLLLQAYRKAPTMDGLNSMCYALAQFQPPALTNAERAELEAYRNEQNPLRKYIKVNPEDVKIGDYIIATMEGQVDELSSKKSQPIRLLVGKEEPHWPRNATYYRKDTTQPIPTDTETNNA
jgi:hypothetical protein